MIFAQIFVQKSDDPSWEHRKHNIVADSREHLFDLIKVLYPGHKLSRDAHITIALIEPELLDSVHDVHYLLDYSFSNSCVGDVQAELKTLASKLTKVVSGSVHVSLRIGAQTFKAAAFPAPSGPSLTA